MSPLYAGLLLAGIALLIAAYVVACDRFESEFVPGPESILDQSRPGTVARSEGVSTAQDKGSCLPQPCRRSAPGNNEGKAPQTAAARPNGRPGVPGGSGSRGATS